MDAQALKAIIAAIPQMTEKELQNWCNEMNSIQSVMYGELAKRSLISKATVLNRSPQASTSERLAPGAPPVVLPKFAREVVRR